MTAGAHRNRAPAFSLIEVVVAIGIIASGVVLIAGLFGTLARLVGGNADFTVAANLGDPLRAYLTAEAKRSHSLDSMRALMRSGQARELVALFASRDGLTIGAGNAPAWQGREAEKFFEIALLPESSVADANSAALLCYVAEIRWPVRTGNGPPPASEKQSILLTGAVSR